MVWFREEHPNWSIETDFIDVSQASAYARATLGNEHGRMVATSHKFEVREGFADLLEKAETGAIGRALALIGYGTQFCADDLNKGRRPVDSPVAALVVKEPEAENIDPGEYQISFGRQYRGRKINSIPKHELEDYLYWLKSNSLRGGTSLQ